MKAKPRVRRLLHFGLSYYVTNGLSAALGLLLISGLAHILFGAAAGSAASVGVIVCIPPDQAAPRRGKFWQLLPAALLGVPLFAAVQVLHAEPLHLGLLLVPATFAAFLGAAWGRRGLPISISVMFAMIFSMAAAQQGGEINVLRNTATFALGAVLYLVYATAANAALNGRYRVQMLADTLLILSGLMRLQARQFAPLPADVSLTGKNGDSARPLVGRVLQVQAALTDHLQTARDILLESPRTPRRQQLATMLLHVLEIRDHLLACELDLDMLRSVPGHAAGLIAMRELLRGLGQTIEGLAEALLTARTPPAYASRRAQLTALPWDDAGTLARGLASRVGHIDTEVLRLSALARGEATPDLAAVRAAWQMFVSPTTWSWRPLAALWHWDAPPLRHAIRAALAIGTAYLIAVLTPWGTHDYWILLTIVVVLRGSLAQTIERRNSRVAGTLLGCLLAGGLLSLHPSTAMILLVVTLAQAVAHGFALKRYLITAVAATVLGLLQAHLLGAGNGTTFELLERVADTLLGVGLAWAFSYVLPSWERTQIPALVNRSMSAQARHARVALGLGVLQAVDNEPELEWRLARREAFDSLSALVQATQRSLVEPRAVRPPVEPLGRLLVHSYQLLAQLTAVKTTLLMGRARLDDARVRGPLRQAAEQIAGTLNGERPTAHTAAAINAGSSDPVALPDPFESDLSPWLLRRLELASALAVQARGDAELVLLHKLDQ